MYPPNWPRCVHCGDYALDGHITCGRLACNESEARTESYPPRNPAMPCTEVLADGLTVTIAREPSQCYWRDHCRAGGKCFWRVWHQIDARGRPEPAPSPQQKLL